MTEIQDVVQNQHKRFVESAKRYALADKSDPFAFARAMTHVNNKIVGSLQNGEDSIYNAEPFQEERVTITGKAYFVTVYRNITRP